ncbi:MAG: hypothetical protein K8T89_14400 [Planctomycetes bacterium]|nr:hypothetical protein [Planctomycetota bacterium]
MPNDAKFGLIVGVVLVLAVAVMFFQKDPAPEARSAPIKAEVAAPSDQPSAARLPAPSLHTPREDKTPGQTTSFVQE